MGKQVTKSASAPTLRRAPPADQVEEEEEDVDLGPAAGAVHAHYARRLAARQRKERKERSEKCDWKPAGNQAAWGQAGPSWGSWAPPWGQQPRTHPPLRSDGQGASKVPGRYDREAARTGLVESRRAFRRTGKEFRFVARAMMEAPPKRANVLEAVLDKRRREAMEAANEADIFEVALEDKPPPRAASMTRLPA